METIKTITTDHGAIKRLGYEQYRFEFKDTPSLNGIYDYKTDEEATKAFLDMVEAARVKRATS